MKTDKIYYIYIIRCNNNSLYTGITTDFKKRISEHNNNSGAKYTRNKGPFLLELLLTTTGRSQATKIELFIKSLTKNKKEALARAPHLIKESFPNIEVVDKSIYSQFK